MKSAGIHVYSVHQSIISENALTHPKYEAIIVRSVHESTISGNTLIGSGATSIHCSADAATLTDNILTGNTGGSCIQVAADTIALTRNRLTGNFNGAVIHWMRGKGEITSNLITNNQAPMLFPYAIYIEEGTPTLNKNAIFNNQTDYNLYYNEPRGSPDLDATNNYWGVITETEIRTKIYDFFQDSKLAVVNVVPFLTKNPFGEEPDILLSVSSHNFGTVLIGDHTDWKLVIYDIGEVTLTVNSIISDNPSFTIPSPTFPQEVSPGDSLNVTVKFSPTEEKSYTGTLIITSNDPDEPNLSISLTGEGKVAKPDLKIRLISFPQTPTAMEPATVELKIINDGDAESSSGDLKVGLCVFKENLQPFQGDVIDLGRVGEIEPGGIRELSFEYTFISNAYSKYLEVTLIPEPGMDANVQNNTERIDFIPLPNEEAYWNCVGEITTIFSFGLLEGKEDIEFAKDVIFYAWDRARGSYGLSDALRERDVKKIITIFGETAWDTGKQIFKLSGKKLVGKIMSYIKLAYSTLKFAKNEGKFLGCGEVLPRVWETLKEVFKKIWEKIKDTGERIFFFIVDSPVDIIVEDSSGNTTSVVQGVITEGIENSFGIEFEGHKAIAIIGNDVYTVKIKGTEAGESELGVFKPDPEGELVSITYKNLPTTDNSIAALVVSQDIADYTLSLDNDGDGTVDETRTPDVFEGITPPTGGALKSENTYAYPNPFNPDRESATLRFSLSESAKVTVRIYDAGGRLVTTLTEDEYMEAGVEQSLTWDGKNDKGDIVANGVYMAVITTDQGERAVCKVAALR